MGRGELNLYLSGMGEGWVIKTHIGTPRRGGGGGRTLEPVQRFNDLFAPSLSCILYFNYLVCSGRGLLGRSLESRVVREEKISPDGVVRNDFT